MNWLKESGTKRGRQSRREVKEKRDGRHDEGLSKRKGKKYRGREKKPILDNDCILKI